MMSDSGFVGSMEYNKVLAILRKVHHWALYYSLYFYTVSTRCRYHCD